MVSSIGATPQAGTPLLDLVREPVRVYGFHEKVVLPGTKLPSEHMS